MARVLFIHPYNHAVPNEIPVGSIAAVNRLGVPVRGRYAHEVEPAEIAEAQVILLDLHWFLPLAVLRGMTDAMRRVNPAARIVVGGITASFFADAGRAHIGADYVVVGDADEALPLLVCSLLAGEAPPPLPNVHGAAHGPSLRRRTRRAALDDNDFLTVDWFPSFRRYVEDAHARYRARTTHALNDYCYPILPVTRGCRRSCSFCYGAFQDDVFGAGARLRTPESVLRDLARIDADPALSFVTLVFADSVYFDAFAPAFAGRRFDLDATLFVCGNIDPSAAATLRGAFGGRVAFSLIQPTDLAPLRLDPSPARQEERFAALLDRFRQMERTIVAVCHVGGPALPAVVSAQSEAGSNVSPLEARDWSMVRPDRTQLDADAPTAAQLPRVDQASRCFAALGALRTFVPDLADAAIPGHFDLGELEHLLERMNPGDFEHRLVQVAIQQIVRRGLYGFDELRLALVGVDGGPSEDGWLHPGLGGSAHAQGTADWHAGLTGFGFQGEIQTRGGHHCVLTATVVVPDEAPLEVARWERARLPAFWLPAGRSRRVTVRAESSRGGLVLEVDDDGAHRRLVLAPPPPIPRVKAAKVEAPVQMQLQMQLQMQAQAQPPDRRTYVEDPPVPLPPERDQMPHELRRVPWPSATWPKLLLQRLLRPAPDPFGALCAYEEHPSHLDLYFRRSHGAILKLSVFPRRRVSRYLAAGVFNFIHWSRDGSDFTHDDLRSFARALVEVSVQARAAVVP